MTEVVYMSRRKYVLSLSGNRTHVRKASGEQLAKNSSTVGSPAGIERLWLKCHVSPPVDGTTGADY